MMQEIREIWLDQTGELGVMEREDRRFGSSFHPVRIVEKTKEVLIINNLWYTTYTGARHFFRLHSNDYRVSGRMQKVDLMFLSDIR